MSTQLDNFTQSLQTLILERERADREGETLLIETLDLTRALHSDIEAAHERYRQGLVALGTRGAPLALQSTNRATLSGRPPWIEAARDQSDQGNSASEQLTERPTSTPPPLSRSASDTVAIDGNHQGIGDSEATPHLKILGGWSNWHGYSR